MLGSRYLCVMKKDRFFDLLSIPISSIALLAGCTASPSTMTMVSKATEEQTEVNNHPRCGLFARDKRCSKDYKLGQCDSQETKLRSDLGAIEVILTKTEDELSDCIETIEKYRDALGKCSSSLTSGENGRIYDIGMGIGVGVLGLYMYQRLAGTKKERKIIKPITVAESNLLPTIREEETAEQTAGDVRGKEKTKEIEEQLETLSQALITHTEKSQEAIQKLTKQNSTLTERVQNQGDRLGSVERENEELKSAISEVQSITQISGARE